MFSSAIKGLQNFGFSAIRTDHLGATEYTVVSILIDVTGSVGGWETELRNALIAAVDACKKSPRSNNLLLRVAIFSTAQPNNVNELHGFMPLVEIDPDKIYPPFRTSGQTPLYDAAFSAVGATVAYGEHLIKDDFSANGIVFIITDGCEYPPPPNNLSTATPAMIKKEILSAVKDEKLESLVTVLIGINAKEVQQELMVFQTEAGIDKYIDVADATKGKLAKLAEFVSQSISSQSQALGTGGPSKNIAATI